MTSGVSDDERAFTALFGDRTPLDRIRMTCGMFDDAKRLVEAGIRSACPAIAAADLRRQVFDRLYTGDFDPDTHARIRARV